MTAIITGDIVNSRSVHADAWLGGLKAILSQIGKEPAKWEIFRGDSFQVMVEPAEALLLALKIKASVKTNRQLDVRMAIGIGTVDYPAKKITESNGSAFVHSGDAFDKKNSQRLVVQTDNPDFDQAVNVLLNLIGLVADDWKPATAETLLNAFSNPELQQKNLAKHMEKSPATVNAALKRGGYTQIMQAVELYKKQIACLNSR